MSQPPACLSTRVEPQEDGLDGLISYPHPAGSPTPLTRIGSKKQRAKGLVRRATQDREVSNVGVI